MKTFLHFPALARSVAAVVLGLTLAVAGCKRAEPQARGPQTVPVHTAQAQRQSVPLLQTAIGSVQPLRTVAVKSQVDGVIAKVRFREGDEVKAGDLLVELDRRPFENALRSAQADLANARAQEKQATADAERYEHLDQQAAVSKEEYAQYRTKAESGRAGVQAKEAAVANAELQLSYTEIRAPIEGRTGQLNLHEGSLVKGNDAGQPIVTINQLAPISVAYSVPEFALTGIRKASTDGQVKVEIVPHASAAEKVLGHLDFIDNSVDPTTGTIVLKALFENGDRRLWPGEFVDVTTVIGEEKDVVTVPAAAVQAGQNGSQVFVVKADHTVELRPVKTGIQTGEATVVLSGVKEGETVVTDGQLRLVPGSKVESKSPGRAPREVAKVEPDEAPKPTEPKS